MASSLETRPRSHRLFPGWYIVLVVLLSGLMVAGFDSFGFGFFLKPISEELGFSRSVIPGAATLRAVVSVALAVPIGFALDRYGPRVLMPLGVLAVGASRILLGAASNLWQVYTIFGVMGSIGLANTQQEMGTTVVAKWFVRYRGRAIAASALGVPLAGVLLTPLTFFLIESLGWRGAIAAIGLLTWAVLFLPALLFMRRTPEDLGLLPDGARQPLAASTESGSASSATMEDDWTVAEALRTPALWFLVSSLTLSNLVMNASQFHGVPYMTDKGFSTATAAAAMMVMGVTSVMAKFIWGFLAERYPSRYLMAACQVFIGSALVILVTGGSPASVMVYGALTGIARAQAIWTSLPYAQYYGRRFLGSLRGTLAPISLIVYAGGPLIPGVLYDLTGSYVSAFTMLAGFAYLSTVLALLARPPRRKAPVASGRDTA